MSSVEAGGATLHLLPQRAAWWPAERTLLVADAHIGKAISFRRQACRCRAARPAPRSTPWPA